MFAREIVEKEPHVLYRFIFFGGRRVDKQFPILFLNTLISMPITYTDGKRWLLVMDAKKFSLLF